MLHHWKTPLNYESDKGLSGSVFSTLEDLVIALRIHSRAVQGDIYLLQGHFGICVLIGPVKHYRIPLWHVCSIEEASLIAYDPQKFSNLIDHLRVSHAQVVWRMGEKRM